MGPTKQLNPALRAAVDDETVAFRQAVVEDVFLRMKTSLEHEFGGPVPMRLNSAVLNTALYSYFYDIERAKQFHCMDRINESKKASYLIKWIVRAKPVFFDPQECPDSLLGVASCINEIFAINVGLAYAELDFGVLDEERFDTLVYQLLYREIEVGLLAVLFEFLAERGTS